MKTSLQPFARRVGNALTSSYRITSAINNTTHTHTREESRLVDLDDRRRRSGAVLPGRGDGGLQADDAQALAAARLAGHEGGRGLHLVLPAAEDGLHVARHALEDDGRDGDEGPVLQRRGQDAVFLGEHEGGAEGVRLGAGKSADDTVRRELLFNKMISLTGGQGGVDLHVNLEEGVENVNVLGLEIHLAKRCNLHHICRHVRLRYTTSGRTGIVLRGR